MRKTVLVLEGDADLRQTILDALEAAGFEVVTAANGLDALEALRDIREPSLILLDLKLPGLDGIEFRRRFLETLQLPAVPVVLLSGDSKGQEQARTLGFPSLKKPFGKKDLQRIVAQYCAEN